MDPKFIIEIDFEKNKNNFKAKLLAILTNKKITQLKKLFNHLLINNRIYRKNLNDNQLKILQSTKSFRQKSFKGPSEQRLIRVEISFS